MDKSLIEQIQDCDFENRINDVAPMLEDIKLYGTLSLIKHLYHILKMAMENQIPQKIIIQTEDDREFEDFVCPKCKDILQQRKKGAIRVTVYHFKYCPDCGQKLDWSDTE